MKFSVLNWIVRWQDRRLCKFSALGSYGIHQARKILRNYELRGLLIGSVAKAVWAGTLGNINKDNGKDTDVLILDLPRKNMPIDHEGSIDWIRFEDGDFLPGSVSCFIDYHLRFKNPADYPPDLYLPHWSILRRIDRHLREGRGFPLYLVKPFELIDPNNPPGNTLPIVYLQKIVFIPAIGGPKPGAPVRIDFISAGLVPCGSLLE